MPQVRSGWQITVSPGLTDVTPDADILDPARVLVPHDVGQQVAARVHDVLPHALDDVQVGAAQARRADPDDHLVRAP